MHVVGGLLGYKEKVLAQGNPDNVFTPSMRGPSPSPFAVPSPLVASASSSTVAQENVEWINPDHLPLPQSCMDIWEQKLDEAGCKPRTLLRDIVALLKPGKANESALMALRATANNFMLVRVASVQTFAAAQVLTLHDETGVTEAKIENVVKRRSELMLPPNPKTRD
jgi:hypothetical protein